MGLCSQMGLLLHCTFGGGVWVGCVVSATAMGAVLVSAPSEVGWQVAPSEVGERYAPSEVGERYAPSVVGEQGGSNPRGLLHNLQAGCSGGGGRVTPRRILLQSR